MLQKTGLPGSWFSKKGVPSRFTIVGIREGVKVKVIVEPAGRGIVTAYALFE